MGVVESASNLLFMDQFDYLQSKERPKVLIRSLQDVTRVFAKHGFDELIVNRGTTPSPFYIKDEQYPAYYNLVRVFNLTGTNLNVCISPPPFSIDISTGDFPRVFQIHFYSQDAIRVLNNKKSDIVEISRAWRIHAKPIDDFNGSIELILSRALRRCYFILKEKNISLTPSTIKIPDEEIDNLTSRRFFGLKPPKYTKEEIQELNTYWQVRKNRYRALRSRLDARFRDEQ